jgi:uracil-DNA glycosylase
METRTSQLADIALDARRYLEWAREVDPQILCEPTSAARAVVPRKRLAATLSPEASPSLRRSPPPEKAAQTTASGAARSLEEIRADLGDCTRCKLSKGRRNIVFGVGNPKAELVFVGEGPGWEEDAKGEPFVGAAGQLLDRMIEAIGFKRSEVYICNVVKCIPPVRPPNNRFPESDEIAACSPFLRAQIEAIRPKVIVALGRCAAQTLLGSEASLSRVRGTWHDFHGIKLMPTFHPAYLLRSPHEKRKAWEDLKKVIQELPRRGEP